MSGLTLNASRRTIGLASFSAMIVCCSFSILNGQQAPPKTDVALDDIHQIAMKVLDAVLKKNVNALLRFETVDWRIQHQTALKDKNSDFYCFLIENHPGCALFDSGSSIFETISNARRPDFAVNDWGIQKDGHRYALLLFYDRSNASPRTVQSRSYYCNVKNFKKIAFWTFMLVDGKWRPVSYLFNYASDSPC